MTENKMPDAVTVWKNNRLYCRDYKNKIEPIYSSNGHIEKYLRAEPVEVLLKQARDALSVGRVTAHSTSADATVIVQIDHRVYDAIDAINKFLGEANAIDLEVLRSAGAKDSTGIGLPVMYTDGEMSREVD